MDTTSSLDDPADDPLGLDGHPPIREICGCMGEIQVGGERALVVWPQIGDSVAVDFARDGHRYAQVHDLDNTPRISVEPLIGRQLSDADAGTVLAAVTAIWQDQHTGVGV